MKGLTNTLLRETLAASRGGFAAVAVFSLFINVLMLTAPLYMLQLFDRVLTSRSVETLVMLTLIAGAALLALAALDALRGTTLVRIGTWLDGRIGGPVLAASITAAVRKGDGATVQGLRDLSTLRTFLTGPGIFPVMDAPWTPIFIAVIFMLHPILGWISLAGALLLFGLAFSNEVATRRLLGRAGGVSVAALHQAEAAVRNANAVEAMGMMPALVGRWHARNVEALALQSGASMRSGGITALSKFARLALQIGVLGTGAWLVILNELTPGAMIAGSILMSRALAPVEQAIGTWRSMIAARGAYERVREQLDESAPRGQAMPLPPPSGRLTVERMSFVHPGAEAPSLRAVSFQLQPGETLGLIGPTAAGKTTLGQLLVGNLVPRAGHVRLDAMDVAQWEAEDLGRHIGYLPQDVELFGGTVRENIARMEKGEADAVVAAARLAGVHDMTLRLPKGYDTEIGEGGAALSGGQRQRIALARAVYGSPRLIVLDEPNANLDGEGEEALVKAIGVLRENRVSIVVIAHRPSILQTADKILVLRAGAVQDLGPRDEVLAKLIRPAGARGRPPDADRRVREP